MDSIISVEKYLKQKYNIFMLLARIKFRQNVYVILLLSSLLTLIFIY